MGAHNIEFRIQSKASWSEITNAFRGRRLADRECNGHQEGYSGDFQTVQSVDMNHLGDIFDSYDEAVNFCLKHAEKWETMVAVYYRTPTMDIVTLIAGWGAS